MLPYFVQPIHQSPKASHPDILDAIAGNAVKSQSPRRFTAHRGIRTAAADDYDLWAVVNIRTAAADDYDLWAVVRRPSFWKRRCPGARIIVEPRAPQF